MNKSNTKERSNVIDLKKSRQIEDAEVLNSAFMKEKIAVESYDRLLKKLNRKPSSFRLSQFQLDHIEAANYWANNLENHPTEVREKLPSIWSKAVDAIVGTAAFVGDTTALKAIQTGEEYNLNHYRNLLESKSINSRHKEKIRKKFIPNQLSHIESINALIKMNA